MDYTEKNKNNIIRKLELELNEHRFSHSLGCAKCAKQLAEKFGLDPDRAYFAGLLHDCAKNFEQDKMFSIIKNHLPEVSEDELSNYKTLHAPVSAYIAKKEYHVDDEEILSAIRWHTLGKLGMSDFEKIIFLADKIEPNTRKADFRSEINAILEEENGLDKAILVCYKKTIASLLHRNLKICQPTIDIYNQLQEEQA